MANTLTDFPPIWRNWNHNRNYSLECQQALREITARRLEAFQAHVTAGGRFTADLGCGDGAFSAALSRARQQWVLGIEAQPEKLLGSHAMGLAGYQQAEKFVMLDRSYEQVLAELTKSFTWLAGRAEQLFMIMPYPQRSFREEVEIWERMGAPRSELHVLTEDGGLANKFRFHRPVQLISFDETACRCPSTFARSFLGQSYEPLLSFGFRRLD